MEIGLTNMLTCGWLESDFKKSRENVAVDKMEDFTHSKPLIWLKELWAVVLNRLF